jgi:predicted secreted protein
MTRRVRWNRAVIPTRIALVAMLLGAMLIGCAGGSPAPGPTVTIDCAAFESQGAGGVPVTSDVSVTVGQGFTVVLCSNPSTGFSWEQPTWEGDATVELVQRSVQQTVGGQAGATGTESFAFNATKAGTTLIHFVYSQPWAGGTKGAWQADVTVAVR